MRPLHVSCICFILTDYFMMTGAENQPPTWTTPDPNDPDSLNFVRHKDTACDTKITDLIANSGDRSPVSFSLLQNPDGVFTIVKNDLSQTDELRCTGPLTESSYTVVVRAIQALVSGLSTNLTLTLTVTGFAADCGTPESASHANFTTSNGSTEDSVVTYVCNSGYKHTAGNLQRTCSSSGTWNGTAPSCSRDCGTPDSASHAAFTTSSGTTENSVVTYVCDNGYTNTAGNLQRTCSSSGTWNGTVPSCSRDCGTPYSVSHAAFTTSSGTTENSMVTYNCDNGYIHFAGNLKRTCTSSGSWSGTAPICLRDCGPPDVVNHARHTTTSGNTENSVVTYFCVIGYVHSEGTLKRTCTSDGTWSGTIPSCVKMRVSETKTCSSTCNNTAYIVVVVILSLTVVALVIYIVYIRLSRKHNAGYLEFTPKRTPEELKDQNPKYVNEAYVQDDTGTVVKQHDATLNNEGAKLTDQNEEETTSHKEVQSINESSKTVEEPEVDKQSNKALESEKETATDQENDEPVSQENSVANSENIEAIQETGPVGQQGDGVRD